MFESDRNRIQCRQCESEAFNFESIHHALWKYRKLTHPTTKFIRSSHQKHLNLSRSNIHRTQTQQRLL